MSEATAAVDELDAIIVTEFVYNSEKNKEWKKTRSRVKKFLNVLLQCNFVKIWNSFCCANDSNFNVTNFLLSEIFFSLSLVAKKL